VEAPLGAEAAVIESKTGETSQFLQKPALPGAPLKSPAIIQIPDLYDSESEEEEFFDAVDAGEIEAELLSVSEIKEKPLPEDASAKLRAAKLAEISPSFRGYEDPIREKLKLDADNRPKISLWVRSLFNLHDMISFLTRITGYPQVDDRQGYDQDDTSSLLQRAYFSSPASGRGHGIC
jgi:hypothetical protein